MRIYIYRRHPHLYTPPKTPPTPIICILTNNPIPQVTWTHYPVAHLYPHPHSHTSTHTLTHPHSHTPTPPTPPTPTLNTSLTNNPISQVITRQLEHILLFTRIIKISSLYFQGELLNKGTSVQRLRIGIGVPSLFFNGQRGFWKDRLKPACKIGTIKLAQAKSSDQCIELAEGRGEGG